MRTDYVVNPAGQTYYYQDDHEGSVTHLTGGSGAVIESYRYDAFGAVTIRNASSTVIPATAFNNRFMFTGREYIKEFSIYEYRARTYHPGLGRFMSEDPKGFDAGDYNLFRYCHNDPEDLTDPMGLATAPDSSPLGATRLEWHTGSHIPERVPNEQQFSLGQVGASKSGVIDKDGNRSSGSHNSMKDAANSLIQRVYNAMTHSASDPAKQIEHNGYGIQSDTNPKDWRTFGPFAGTKGAVKDDAPTKTFNQSGFMKSDPSPSGYHRVFAVYSHPYSQSEVDAKDRVRYSHMTNNGGQPLRVYLVVPPHPGSGFNNSARVLPWTATP